MPVLYDLCSNEATGTGYVRYSTVLSSVSVRVPFAQSTKQCVCGVPVIQCSQGLPVPPPRRVTVTVNLPANGNKRLRHVAGRYRRLWTRKPIFENSPQVHSQSMFCSFCNPFKDQAIGKVRNDNRVCGVQIQIFVVSG